MTRFDPLQRARDFTRGPHPRRQARSEARRLDAVEQKARDAITLASLGGGGGGGIETVEQLPDPTSEDIGRVVQLRGVAGEPSRDFIGDQKADDSMYWREITSTDAVIVDPVIAEFVVDTTWNALSEGTAIGMAYNDLAGIITIAVDDAELLALSGLTSAADRVPYFTGSGTAALATFTPAGRSLAAMPADPNADRLVFWDDSAGAFAYLTADTTDLVISGTTLSLASAPTFSDFTNAQHDHGDADDGGLIPLNNLSDVSLSAPAQGQLLTYDAGGVQWVNADPQQGIITVDDRAAAFGATFGAPGAGNGQFVNAGGMAIDASGNIYVADPGNDRVQKFTSGGVHSSNVISSLDEVNQVCLDASANIYVAYRHAVGSYGLRKYNPAGVLQWQHNAGVSGVMGANTPYGGIATDGTYVYGPLSTGDGMRVANAATGAFVANIGSSGGGAGQFNDCMGIATDGSYLYIVDQGNDRIVKWSTGAAPIAVGAWGRSGSDPGEFQLPYSIAYDAVNDFLAVTDQTRDDVQLFTTEGAYIGEFASPGSGSGQLQEATGIAAIPSGDSWWVADATQERLQRFDITVTSEEATRVSFNTNDFIVASTDAGETAFISLAEPANSLQTLADVDTSGAVAGDLLMFNGANWIEATITTRTTVVSIPSGNGNTGTATCLAGEVALSGGIEHFGDDTSVNTRLTLSRPSGANAWKAGVYNASAAAHNATIYVRCLGG